MWSSGTPTLLPQRFRLEVGFQAHLRVAFEVGHVEPVRVKAVHLCEQLPRPADRLLLEVVAEGPIPQHFEESMMVAVFADIVKILDILYVSGRDSREITVT